MKKLTGPFLLAAALLTHIGIVIATEEDYTFSSSDYSVNPATQASRDENRFVTPDRLITTLSTPNDFHSSFYAYERK